MPVLLSLDSYVLLDCRRLRRMRGVEASCPQPAADLEVALVRHQLLPFRAVGLRLLREFDFFAPLVDRVRLPEPPLRLCELDRLARDLLVLDLLGLDVLALDLLERLLPRLLPRFVCRAGRDPCCWPLAPPAASCAAGVV
jgi:hypothetical protein